MISIHLSSKKLEGRYPVDLSKDKVRDLPSDRECLHVFDKHRVSQSTLHSHHPSKHGASDNVWRHLPAHPKVRSCKI